MKKNFSYKITLDKTKLNSYQQGRIYGSAYILAGKPKEEWAWTENGEGTRASFIVNCDRKQLQAIVEEIERAYPGVIINNA